VTFNDKEATLALLFLAVTADGDIAPEEEELVIAASNRMKLLRKQSIDEFNGMVWKIREAIEASGRDAVFEASVKGVPPDLNETIYALCADIVFAEDSANPSELEYLRREQEALQISDEFATKVIEVMRVMNRG